MERNLEDIVSEVLRSPHLRTTLEDAVRNLNVDNRTPAVSSPAHMQTTNGNGNIGNTPVLSAITTGQNSVRSPSVTQELQRLFPSIPKSPRNPEPRRGNKRKRILKDAYFNRDVILLKSPHDYRTLRGIHKFYAFENGYGISNVEFGVNWTFEEIRNFIKQLFNKYLESVEFEIMVPVGGRLIKPSLPPGKRLDGSSMKSIFLQKIVYLRPLTDLSSDISVHSTEGNSVNETVDSWVEIADSSNGSTSGSTEVRLSESSRQCVKEEENNPMVYATTSHSNNDDDTLFQSNLALAIKNSLTEEKKPSLETIFQELQSKITDQSTTHFNVYRDDIFNCCIRAISRKTFRPFNKIFVKFSDVEGLSEEAIDLGGPTREAFRLVMEHIRNSRLFFGENKKYIRLDSEYLENNQYFYAGRLVALSLIHGGPAPHFFSESFFYILTSENVKGESLNINDLEENIKEKIIKFNEMNDIELLQDYITDEPIFSIAGCHFIKSLDEKNNIFKNFVEFYAYHRVRAALEQFKAGLETTGNVLNLMKRYPVIFEDLMCGDKLGLTLNFMQDFFSIDYSEIGSSKRSLENRTISFWRDFVEDCSEEESETSLEEILIFCTGANELPPLGFHVTPKIMFLHDESPYPKSNTCALQLHLPIVHKTYTEFKQHVNFGIGNSGQFGFA